MKYALAFGSNVNRKKMEITVFKDPNSPQIRVAGGDWSEVLRGETKDDRDAENAQ